MKRRATLLVLLGCALALLPGPVRADDPVRVSTAGVPATLVDTATDREGDTVIASVERRPTGNTFSLEMFRSATSPGWRTSLDVPDLWAQLHVAVDDDGDGIVVWDSIDEFSDDFHSELYARRFTRDGKLGPLLVIDADTYVVDDVAVAMRPGGTAIVTWPAETETEHRTPVRTVDRQGRLGPELLVARAPVEPSIAVERSGRATLVWSDDRNVYARRLRTDGTLAPTRLVRRAAYRGEGIFIEDVDVDRRGAVTAACHRYTPNTAFPGHPSNSYSRVCMFATTPGLRLRRDVRYIGRRADTPDFAIVDVAASGRGLVGWQRNYYEGAFVRPIRSDGSLGRIRRVATGGLGQITLRSGGDGFVSSTRRAPDGNHRIIRLTRIRDARVATTRDVFTSGHEVDHVSVGTGTTGPAFLSWTDQTSGSPEVLAVSAR